MRSRIAHPARRVLVPVLAAALVLGEIWGRTSRARRRPVASGAVGRIAVVGAILLLAEPTQAAEPPPDQAQLRYEIPAGVVVCPTEPYVHHFVAARFGGTDPFVDTAARRILVKVRRDRAGWVVALAMEEAGGKPLGSDELSGATCPGAVDAAAHRIVSWLIPIVGPDPAALPQAPPAPQVSPPPAELPAATPAPLPLVPVRFAPRVGLGVRADFGAAWGAIFGVTLGGGFLREEWRWGGWSVMGTLRFAPEQTGIGPPTAAASNDVRALLIAGRLAGCVHRSWPVSLAGCFIGELGEIQQAAEVALPSYPSLHQTALYAGAGAGARVEVPLPAHFHLRLDADVLGVGHLAGNTSAWVKVNSRRFDGAAGGLGAGVGFEL